MLIAAMLDNTIYVRYKVHQILIMEPVNKKRFVIQYTPFIFLISNNNKPSMISFFSFQFISKTLFKDGDLGPSKHVNNTAIVHTYIQNNIGSPDKRRQTQLTLSYKNISITTHT